MTREVPGVDRRHNCRLVTVRDVNKCRSIATSRTESLSAKRDQPPRWRCWRGYDPPVLDGWQVPDIHPAAHRPRAAGDVHAGRSLLLSADETASVFHLLAHL